MVAAAAVCLTALPAAAQTSTSIPRTPEGKPDLSGFWQVMHTSAWLDIQDHAAEKSVPAGRASRWETRSRTCQSRFLLTKV